MWYSLMYNSYLCRRCTLVQYYVYVVYLYVMSQVYVVYSCMLCYYMHLYSYCSLDLVLRGSMRYTIVLCLYMYLFMYDSLILYDCYILICLVCILICVVCCKCWKSAKHRTLVWLVVQHCFIVLSSDIDKSYGLVV